jgi:hypothetical protein
MFRDATHRTDYGAGIGPIFFKLGRSSRWALPIAIFFVAQHIFMPSIKITGVDK